jgi:hypothetical protein
MDDLFDLTLDAAVGWAERRVPGFAEMSGERQSALLELIVWLGPFNVDGVFGDLEQLGLPLTAGPLEASPWFDRLAEEEGRPRADPSAWPRPTSYEITFESYGVVAQLACDDPELFVAAQAMLPPQWRRVDASPSIHFGLSTDGLITVGGGRADRSPHRESLLLKLASVVRHRIALEAPGLTFVHAGVVAVGGCGIVIPGRTYTGKSMLVAELVRLGATYLSDEYAVIDGDGRVVPFAKPLSIRTGRGEPLGRLVDVPRERVAQHPVRAGVIVLTAYAPEAEWNPSVRSTGEGAMALLQNTVSARRTPGSALGAVGRVARDAVVLSGLRGEASDAAPLLIEAALRQSESWTTVQP